MNEKIKRIEAEIKRAEKNLTKKSRWLWGYVDGLKEALTILQEKRI